MNDKLVTPVSAIYDVQRLADALYHDRFEICRERTEIGAYDSGLGVSKTVYATPRQWAEIGGVTNQRAAAILKDFLDEFQVILAERDQLKTTLRTIAETAIKAGDV